MRVETLALTHPPVGKWTATRREAGLALSLSSVALSVTLTHPTRRAGMDSPSVKTGENSLGLNLGCFWISSRTVPRMTPPVISLGSWAWHRPRFVRPTPVHVPGNPSRR